MNTYTLVMLLSVAIFFFVVLPALVISVALGVFIWLFAIGMFLGGWTGRRNQIRAERVRRRAELEEEGRQRVIARYENPAPTQVARETVIAKEVVLIQCRHCGARYPQGTVKCLTCGANL